MDSSDCHKRIFIEFDTITYVVSARLASGIFFREMANYIFKHDIPVIKCDEIHREVFEILNTNDAIYKYLQHMNVTDLTASDRQLLYKRLQYTYDYFQVDLTKLHKAIDFQEQECYRLEVNKYIILVLNANPTLKITGINSIYCAQLFHEYIDRFDFRGTKITSKNKCQSLSSDIVLKYFNKRDIISNVLTINSAHPLSELLPYCTNANNRVALYSMSCHVNEILALANITGHFNDLAMNKHLTDSQCHGQLSSYVFDHYNESGDRFPHKYISDMIVEAGVFNEWSDISPEFLSLEIIKQNIHSINLRHLKYNINITDEFYDELKLYQARMLNTSNKITERFLTNHDILFNPCNSRLSNMFILSNANRINPESKELASWKITNEFAIELLQVLAADKKYKTISRLFNNLNINYNILEQYEHLVSNKQIPYINRYEYIAKNMHAIYLFECIPFRIYKENSLTILFDRIKPTYN